MPEPRLGRAIKQSQQRIARELQLVDFALPGSVIRRDMRCGKPGCRCKADPPQLHGPYFQWTRKVNGKTVTRLLTEDQLSRYQGWFDNARKLRRLLAELEALSLKAFEQTEGDKS